jgi:hypothetical protein
MKTQFSIVLVVIVLLIGMMNTIRAESDEVGDLIDYAKKAYLENDYRNAAAQLNKALDKINQLLVNDLKSFLPEPFNGWDADPPEGGASGLDLLSKLSVKRRYFKRGTGKSIEFEIISNSPQIPSLRMWLSNPQILNSKENIQIDEIDDKRCITRFEALDRFAEVNMIVGSSMLVRIRGFEAKNLDDVKDFAKKLDVKKMEVKFP